MIFDKWLTAGVGVLACIVGFTAGQTLGDLRLKEERNAHLKAMQEVQKQNEEELRRREDSAKAAVDSLLSQLSDADHRNRSLAQSAARLREQLKLAGGSAMPASSGIAGGTCGERLARCAELLGEGGELLAEGSGICERIAVRKDAIRDYRR